MLHVIGVGFGRTGTTSLKLALDRLGLGPCDHMFDIMEDPRRLHRWVAMAEGRETAWSDLFAGYRATVDWPGAAYWRELAACYPEAKLILTVREPERWYESVQATIFRHQQAGGVMPKRLIARLMFGISPDLGAFARMVELTIARRVFDGDLRNKEHLLKVFHQHNAEVTAEIPADRLLVYDVKEGWEPLCSFLRLPVPAEPFPRANDGKHFEIENRRRIRRLLASGLRRRVSSAGRASLT